MELRKIFIYFMRMRPVAAQLLILFLLVIPGALLVAGADRSASMGTVNGGISAVSFCNIFSAGHNQAAAAFLERPGVGVIYSSVYLTTGINNFALAGAYPFKKAGTLSLSMNYFGYSAYKDINAGIGYSLKLAKNFSVGAQIDLLSTSIQGYGNKKWISFEFGMYARPLKKLSIGAHIYNPLRYTSDESTGEKLPTIVKAGLTYEPNEKLHFSAEYKQDIDVDPIFTFSGYYRAHDILSLRVGFNSLTAVAFGIGLHFKELDIDIGSTYRHPLGFSPYSALAYEF